MGLAKKSQDANKGSKDKKCYDGIHKRQQTILRLNINVNDFGDPNVLGFGNQKVAVLNNDNDNDNDNDKDFSDQMSVKQVKNS